MFKGRITGLNGLNGFSLLGLPGFELDPPPVVNGITVFDGDSAGLSQSILSDKYYRISTLGKQFSLTCNFIFLINITHILTVFRSNALVPLFITFTLLPSWIATCTFWSIVFFLIHFIVFMKKNSFLVYLPFTLATIFCFGPKVIWCLKYLIGVTNSFVLTIKTSILVYTKTLSEVFRFEKYFLYAFSQYIPWSEKSVNLPNKQSLRK